MSVVRLDEEDLDEEDLAILREVASKGGGAMPKSRDLAVHGGCKITQFLWV